MLPICKSTPDPLQQFRKRADATYDSSDFPKKEVKESLLREQGFLCAYCMSRITEETMSIEHWQPQHPVPRDGECSAQEREVNRCLSIDYANMLAVCDGNGSNPFRQQHCDRRKKNTVLKYNPANPDHHAKLGIRYIRSNGKIESGDADFCRQLGGTEKGSEGVLNLNLEKLRNNRLAVIASVFKALSRLKGTATRKELQRMHHNWSAVNAEGKRREYAGVAIYFLEKRIAKT